MRKRCRVQYKYILNYGWDKINSIQMVNSCNDGENHCYDNKGGEIGYSGSSVVVIAATTYPKAANYPREIETEPQKESEIM